MFSGYVNILFADRRQYGPVKEVRMALNADNHSKGFAFIEFEEEVGLSAESRACARGFTLALMSAERCCKGSWGQ